MINFTSEAIIKNLKKGDIEAVCRQQIQIEQSEYRASPTRFQKTKVQIANNIRDSLRECESTNSILDDLIQIGSNNVALANELATSLEYLETAPNGHKRSILRAQAKNILFLLWSRDHIILPMDFNLGSSVKLETRLDHGSELVRFISSYRAIGEDKSKFGSQVEYRITQHSLAWIYATDWHVLGEISLKDIGLLWDELQRQTSSNKARTTPPSLKPLFGVLLDRDTLGFTTEEFANFEQQRSIKYRNKAISTRFKKSDEGYSHGGSRNYGFFALPEHLEGTSHEFPKECAERWNRLFEEYLRYRIEVKQFEETTKAARKLYVFADYIAYYLPLTAYDAGQRLPVIDAPKSFKSYPYVNQGERKHFFGTFLDYLRTRNKKVESLRSAVTAISEFFKWIEHRYGDVEFASIAGPEFRNPLDVKFDIPKSKRPNGTNKVPFGAETLPHLLSWLYAVEEFGCYVQSRGEDAWRGFELRRGYNDHVITCADYDFEPEYTYLGDTYRIKKVPLSLLAGRREISAGLNLSALRMVLTALETGLRFQAVQWLDRNSWDSRNGSICEGDSFCRLFVNTDKTKDCAWTTFIPIRVRELLLRQEADLKRIGVRSIPVDYEDRPHSRFEKVVPLFATRVGRHINDGSYDRFWKICLYAFAGFGHSSQLNLPPLLSLVQSTGKLSQPMPNSQGYLYCKLKIEPIHTPHSVRSTYITRRSDVSDHVDLGRMVGQNDPVVTAHYDYPEHHRMIDVLDAAEQSLIDPASTRSQAATIKSGPAILKAKSANSALRMSFNADRNETIERFRMISLAKSLEDADETGIDLLRNSRSADIVFRDTHICPVGEECPDDVVVAAGGMMRCGVCKLACKSIDHLPAITAKIRAIKGRIRHNSSLFKTVKRAGDRNEEMRSIAKSVETDAYELAGWEQSEIMLRDLLEDADHKEWFLTDEPEIVRDHLERVVKSNDQQQFLANRILDADAYPAIITDDLRMKAARLMRHVRAEKNFEDIDPDSDIKSLASAMKVRMRSIGLADDQAGELLRDPSLLFQKPQIKLVTEN